MGKKIGKVGKSRKTGIAGQLGSNVIIQIMERDMLRSRFLHQTIEPRMWQAKCTCRSQLLHYTHTVPLLLSTEWLVNNKMKLIYTTTTKGIGKYGATRVQH